MRLKLGLSAVWGSRCCCCCNRALLSCVGQPPPTRLQLDMLLLQADCRVLGSAQGFFKAADLLLPSAAVAAVLAVAS